MKIKEIIGKIKCFFGLHILQINREIQLRKVRTNRKGKAPKRFVTWRKDIYDIIFCCRCGKVLGIKHKHKNK